MANPDEEYNEAYFLRGKETGVSLYEDYRWLPNLTIPMAWAIIAHLGVCHDETITDFGCARGYLVKALRGFGLRAGGIDCSAWAVENADSEIRDWVWRGTRLPGTSDWVIAKDVLEHVEDLLATVEDLMAHAGRGVFVVVPLGISDGGTYVVPEYEKDVTHVHRLTLPTWAGLFMKPGWAVTAQYRVRGVKDNYAHFERGNGFITARRLGG